MGEESGQQRPKEDAPNRLTAKRLRREQAKKDASEWAVNATAESATLLGRWRSPSPVQRDSPVYALDEEFATALPAPMDGLDVSAKPQILGASSDTVEAAIFSCVELCVESLRGKMQSL